MAAATIQAGDRVVTTQIPGVFVVLGRRGQFLEIESGKGLRLTVLESALRRLDGNGAGPSDG
jgi:hypothetical protein